MERLTNKTSIMGRKHDLAYGCASIWKKKLSKHYRYNLIEEAVDKLGQLEDIEEELGIDLITLFKALNSCWFKYNFEIIGDIRPSLRFINGEWCLISNIERIAFPYPLRLYGKTWFLDRSELEND